MKEKEEGDGFCEMIWQRRCKPVIREKGEMGFLGLAKEMKNVPFPERIFFVGSTGSTDPLSGLGRIRH